MFALGVEFKIVRVPLTVSSNFWWVIIGHIKDTYHYRLGLEWPTFSHGLYQNY